VEPAQFFVSNLASLQPSLEPALLLLQRRAGLGVLEYLRAHASMIVRACNQGEGEGEGPDPDAGLVSEETGEKLGGVASAVEAARKKDDKKYVDYLLEWEPIATQILAVLKNVNRVYEREPDRLLAIIDRTCSVLEVFSGPPVGAKAISTQWQSGRSLKALLPPPLSVASKVGSAEYSNGLGRLSPALLRLIANLCQTQQGLSDTLSDGFLSSALAKIDALFPILNDSLVPYAIFANLRCFPPPLLSLPADIQYVAKEVSACLILCARCANYASQVFGSANDMMLLPHHRLFERCAHILQSRLPVPADPDSISKSSSVQNSGIHSRATSARMSRPGSPANIAASVSASPLMSTVGAGAGAGEGLRPRPAPAQKGGKHLRGAKLNAGDSLVSFGTAAGSTQASNTKDLGDVVLEALSQARKEAASMDGNVSSGLKYGIHMEKSSTSLVTGGSGASTRRPFGGSSSLLNIPFAPHGEGGSDQNSLATNEDDEDTIASLNMFERLGRQRQASVWITNRKPDISSEQMSRWNYNQISEFWFEKVPWDELQSAALKALCALSSDSVRLLPQFESLDIVGLMKGTLCRIENVPKPALGLCCTGVVSIARSLRNDYLKRALPTLRVCLQAVPLKYPALLGAVRAASWQVMKASVDQEKAAAKLVAQLAVLSGSGSSGTLPVGETKWEPDHFGPTVDSILTTRLRALLQEAGLTAKEAEKEALSKEGTPQLSRETSSAGTYVGPSMGPSSGSSMSASASATGNATAAALHELTSPIRHRTPAELPALRPIPMLSRIGTQDSENDDSGYSGGGGGGGRGGPASPFLRTPSLHPPGYPDTETKTYTYAGGMDAVKTGHPHSSQGQGQGQMFFEDGRPDSTDASATRGVNFTAHTGTDTASASGSYRSGSLSPKSGFVEKKRSIASLKGHQVPGSPIRRPGAGAGSGSGLRARTTDRKGGKRLPRQQQQQQQQTMVIDVSDLPGFLESRPPVFKLKADEAFIC